MIFRPFFRFHTGCAAYVLGCAGLDLPGDGVRCSASIATRSRTRSSTFRPPR
jgi:hypothetical protein